MKKITTLILTLSAITTFAGQPDYFPDGTIDDFCEQWYGEHLSVMNEPSLYPSAEDSSNEIYRFTLLPTWGRSVSIRVEVKKSIITIHTVKLTGSGGYDPGEIKFRKTLTLNPNQSSELIGKLNSLNFFSMSLEDDTNGRDGSKWIFEGVKNGKYHVISRWCPDVYYTEKRNLVEFVSTCNLMLEYLKKDSNQSSEPTRITPADEGKD